MRVFHVAVIVLLIQGVPWTGQAQSGFQTPGVWPFPETTIDGVVEQVDAIGSDTCEACQACSDCTGTHLLVRKGSARIEVHLAPAWFLERSKFEFAPGDVVSVVGTRIVIRRKRGMLAREVQRDGVVMRLRDRYGLPLWRRELTEQPETTGLHEIRLATSECLAPHTLR